MGRLRLVAASGIFVTAAAGGWLLLNARHASEAPKEPAETTALPAVRRTAGPWDRWTITEHFAAQHVMVLQIETTHLDEAAAIARTVAGPLQHRYSEIMIYFHRPGRPDTLPPRRVQWSREAGYVETDFQRW